MQRQDYSQNSLQNVSTSVLTDETFSQNLLVKEQVVHDQTTDEKLHQLLLKVGGQGKYQIIISIILCMIWLTSSMFLVGLTFFFDDTYKCYQTDNQDLCKEIICKTSSADRFQFISQHTSSLVFQFDLLCGQSEFTIKVLQSMIYVGSLIGYVLFPSLTTKYGIQKILRVAWFFCSIGALLFTFSVNEWMSGVGLLIIGFGASPATTLCYSLVGQQCSKKYCQYFAIAFMIFFAGGQCLIGALFWTPLTWRQICYMICAIIVIINFLLLYIVEGYRYLAIYQSKQKSLKALNNIAHKNHQKQLLMNEIDSIELQKQRENQKTTSFLLLFKQKPIRIIALSTGMIFAGVETVYYTTALSLETVGYDKILNQIMTGAAEIFSYLTVEFFVHRLRRKKFSIFSTLLTTIVCLGLALLMMFKNQQNLKEIEGIQTGVLIMLRMINTAFWGFFYVYCVELFSAEFLSLGLGFASLCGMLGCIGSPYFILVSQLISVCIWYIVAGISFITTLFVLLLPQTKNKLPQQQDNKNPQMITNPELTFKSQNQSTTMQTLSN